MFDYFIKKLGYISVNKHNAIIDAILDTKKLNSPAEIRQTEIDALFDRENEAFKVALFKRTFNTRSGRLILEYLKKMYTVSIPNFDNASVNYFHSGKRRVVEEIEINANRQLKRRKKDEFTI